MDWSADHAAYVAAAFVVSALALASFSLWVVLRDRRFNRKSKDDGK